MSSTYAVILAGGSGRRFWPLSRDNKPKQLLKLFGEQTLLEQALERLDGRLAVCPVGERPPEPLELVGMQAVACRLEGGAVVVVSPVSG